MQIECTNKYLLIISVSFCRNPLWMVVNTTIHAEVKTIELTNTAMKDLMEELMKEYCSPHERSKLIANLNCDMEEYEHTKAVLEKIDDIQETLFNENIEKARLEAMLGFIDIMKLFDERIKAIFEEEVILRCPNEIQMIKSDYLYGSILHHHNINIFHI